MVPDKLKKFFSKKKKKELTKFEGPPSPKVTFTPDA